MRRVVVLDEIGIVRAYLTEDLYNTFKEQYKGYKKYYFDVIEGEFKILEEILEENEQEEPLKKKK